MELLTEFLGFLCWTVFWYLVLQVLIRVIFGNIEKTIDEEAEKIRDKLSKMIHRINQEKHGDMYYWFDRDSDEFIAQGKTDTEIINHVKSRFPTHIFILNDEKGLRGPDWKVVPLQELTQK